MTHSAKFAVQTALCISDWKFKHTAAYTQSNSVTGSLPTGHHKHLKGSWKACRHPSSASINRNSSHIKPLLHHQYNFRHFHSIFSNEWSFTFTHSAQWRPELCVWSVLQICKILNTCHLLWIVNRLHSTKLSLEAFQTRRKVAYHSDLRPKTKDWFRRRPRTECFSDFWLKLRSAQQIPLEFCDDLR